MNGQYIQKISFMGSIIAKIIAERITNIGRPLTEPAHTRHCQTSLFLIPDQAAERWISLRMRQEASVQKLIRGTLDDRGMK